MIGAAQRFEGVDRELATVTRDLQDGLRGFAQQINELVKATNADLSKAVTHLDGAIRQLDETLEDRVPRPVAARGGS
jgi:hypothetical protein